MKHRTLYGIATAMSVLCSGCGSSAAQAEHEPHLPLLPQESAPIFSKVKREVSKDGIIYYFFPNKSTAELAKLVEGQKFFVDEGWEPFKGSRGHFASVNKRVGLKEGELDFIRLLPERFERGTMMRIPTDEGSTIVLGTYRKLPE